MACRQTCGKLGGMRLVSITATGLLHASGGRHIQGMQQAGDGLRQWVCVSAACTAASADVIIGFRMPTPRCSTVDIVNHGKTHLHPLGEHAMLGVLTRDTSVS
jgi:hypothetical protein